MQVHFPSRARGEQDACPAHPERHHARNRLPGYVGEPRAWRQPGAWRGIQFPSQRVVRAPQRISSDSASSTQLYPVARPPKRLRAHRSSCQSCTPRCASPGRALSIAVLPCYPRPGTFLRARGRTCLRPPSRGRLMRTWRPALSQSGHRFRASSERPGPPLVHLRVERLAR